MRYEKADNMLQLAIELQARRTGMTLGDIQERFDVGKRTAMRMRDAILRNFPQTEEVETDDRTKRWRMPSGIVNTLVNFSADELADLNSAIKLLRRNNRKDQAANLDTLETKLRALLRPDDARRVEPDLEALMEAEGIAARPGPRPRIKVMVIEDLRLAIKGFSCIKMKYRRRSDRKLKTYIAEPYGFLHGHRHYLVTRLKNAKKDDFRTFILSAIESVEVMDDSFERDPEFSLEEYSMRSFGVYQEEPFEVVWRFTPEAAADAKEYVFHPSQRIEVEEDGSLLVKFTAGGDLEMAWHLYTWGDQVEVIEPKRLANMIKKHRVGWKALP